MDLIDKLNFDIDQLEYIAANSRSEDVRRKAANTAHELKCELEVELLNRAVGKE